MQPVLWNDCIPVCDCTVSPWCATVQSHDYSEGMRPHASLPILTVGQLGQEVRRARRDLGLTQADLAKKALVSRRWLSQLECGHLGAEIGKIMRVVRALDLAVTLEPAPPAAP